MAEGDVEIGKVFGLQAKIVPVTSSGRWRGRHTVQLSNWGNAPAKLRIVASDPDAALGFYVRPDVVELPLGGSATVRVSVRTRKPVPAGQPGAAALPDRRRTGRRRARSPAPPLPYADPSRPVVDGALNQKPILSKAVVALLGLVLVAGLGLGAYALVCDPRPGRGPGPSGPAAEAGAVPSRPRGPDAVLVSWEPIEGVRDYRLFSVDPDEQIDPGAGQQSRPARTASWSRSCCR